MWQRNSRSIIHQDHLRCPVCQHQIDLDHQEALDHEVKLLASLVFVSAIYTPNETLPTGFTFR